MSSPVQEMKDGNDGSGCKEPVDSSARKHQIHRDATLHQRYTAQSGFSCQSPMGDVKESTRNFDYVNETTDAFARAASDSEIENYSCYITQPGRVQDHGVSFLVDEGSGGRVIACSANTDLFFGRHPSLILGRAIKTLFRESDKLTRILKMTDLSFVNPVILSPAIESSAPATRQPGRLNVILQRTEDGLLIDVEECGDEAVEGAWQSHRRLQKTIDKLQQARTMDGMFKCVVDDVHACTGYDRVLIYKFHPDFHGEVVAECKGPSLRESWLGLHYPATDIPQRSRDLFKANCVRLIYDANSKPSELVSESPARAPESISLASSTLRAVHPCHLEYLQNMGVKASLVLSVVIRGSLWGLIVCHHYATPRFVPFQTRTACEFLLQAFSIRMTSVLESEQQVKQDRKNHVHASLSENMARGKDHDSILYGIFCTDANICHLIPDTCGAAVVFAGKIMQFGEVPDDETIRKIVRWRQGQPGDQPLAITNLARQIPGFDNIGSGVAGALCAPFVDQGMLLWFRPEFTHTIRWAGDPALKVSVVPGRTMMPRNSFEAFTQSVVGQCAAWTAENLQDAEALVRLVDEVLISSDQDLRSNFLEQFRARLLQDRAACKLVGSELSRLINQAAVPVFAADKDGVVVEWNERCAALSGVPHEAAVGRRLGELKACHGPLLAALAACTGQEMRNFPVRMGQHDLLFVAPARRIAGGRVVGVVFIGQEAPEAARMLGGWGDAGLCPPTEDGTAFSVSSDGKVETWSAGVAAMTQIGASAVQDRLLAGQVFGGALPLLDSTAAVRLEVTIASSLAGSQPRPLELLFSRADRAVMHLVLVARDRPPGAGVGVDFYAYDVTRRRALEMADEVCGAAVAMTGARTEQLGLLCRGMRRSLSEVLAAAGLLERGPLGGGEDAPLLHATKRCGAQLLTIVNDIIDLRSLGAACESGVGEEAKTMLQRVMPEHVVSAMMRGEKVPPERKDAVTMFFSDVAGFVALSSRMDEARVSDLLNRLYAQFDDLAHYHGIHKLETIGDAYLAATNLGGDQVDDHAARMAQFAMAAAEVAAETVIDTEDARAGFIQIRVGLHSGPVTACVLGQQSPKYTLLGDTVNVASRMETNSRPGYIHCTQATADLIRAQDPTIPLHPRDPIEIKGKGLMQTYWVNRRPPSSTSAPESPMSASSPGASQSGRVFES